MKIISPIILIVDDDPDLLEMYEEVFQIEGSRTITARSATEAIEICKNQPSVKVIISDAQMGKISGLEFLKILNSYYQTMPVFYLSTGSFDISEESVKREGGKELVLKPFDLSEILEKIKRDINS